MSSEVAIACATEKLDGYAFVTPNIKHSCKVCTASAALHCRVVAYLLKLCFLSVIFITSQLENESIISYKPRG